MFRNRFLDKSIYENDKSEARENAEKYETNSKLVLDQLSVVEKRLTHEFNVLIRKTIDSKFVQYDDVCKSFTGFFNSENLYYLMS